MPSITSNVKDEVWVITGVKFDVVKNFTSVAALFREGKPYPIIQSNVVGKFRQVQGRYALMMHGSAAYKLHDPDTNKDFGGYGLLIAAFMPYSEFMALPDKEKVAVTGGFVYSSDGENTINEKKWAWGVQRGECEELGKFRGLIYNNNTYASSPILRPCFYFNNRDLAPITTIWQISPNRPDEPYAQFGANVKSPMIKLIEKIGQDSASLTSTKDFALSLAGIKSKSIVAVNFPEWDSSLGKTDTAVGFKSAVSNDTESEVTKEITVEFSANKEFSFGFEEGLDVEWGAEFKASVPLIGEAKTHLTTTVSFGANQQSTTTEGLNYSEKVSVIVKPHSAVQIEGLFTTARLALDGKMTLQIEYDNGALQQYTVPVKFESVNVYNATVRVFPIPIPEAAAGNGVVVKKKVLLPK